jgi:hypothetical protein
VEKPSNNLADHFSIRIDGGEESLQAPTLEEARAEAKDWAESGDYGGATAETQWIDARILQNGDYVETVTVAIDPEEPDCSSEDGHDWSPDRIYGHGGGATISNTCRACGIRKTIDTWASRADTGEQGLKSLAFDYPDKG